MVRRSLKEVSGKTQRSEDSKKAELLVLGVFGDVKFRQSN
jgi:hypothetical protein